MSGDDLKVLETGPREVAGIVLRFDPAFGLMCDSFPERTAILDQALDVARSYPGVVAIEGKGGIGSRVRFTAANGEAVYDLTHRVDIAGHGKGFEAERRSFRLCVVGVPQEVETFNGLDRFTDAWPEYAGFTDDFLKLGPPHVIRCGREVTVYADGVRADYRLISHHPVRKGGYLMERYRLKLPGETIVALPTARASAMAITT